MPDLEHEAAVTRNDELYDRHKHASEELVRADRFVNDAYADLEHIEEYGGALNLSEFPTEESAEDSLGYALANQAVRQDAYAAGVAASKEFYARHEAEIRQAATDEDKARDQPA